jgi:hypothetical protein
MVFLANVVLSVLSLWMVSLVTKAPSQSTLDKYFQSENVDSKSTKSISNLAAENPQ